MPWFKKKYKEKYNQLKEKIERLDYSLYLQINTYARRADTKYHRGIIDSLFNIRQAINKIIEEEKDE